MGNDGMACPGNEGFQGCHSVLSREPTLGGRSRDDAQHSKNEAVTPGCVR